MKIPKVVSIYALFPFSTETASFQQWFIKVMRDVDSRLLPGRYGQFFPLKKNIVDDDFEPFIALEKDVEWRGRARGIEGRWFKTCSPPQGLYSYFKILTKISSTNQPPVASSLMQLFECACRKWPVHIGSIHYNSSHEVAEQIAWDTDNQVIFGPINIRWLEMCLPNIAWGTFFGKPYVDLIGAERFESAPAARVERWLDGYYVQLTDRIEDREDNWEFYRSRRDAVKEHLGRNLFFIPGQPRDQYLAPKFQTLPVSPAE